MHLAVGVGLLDPGFGRYIDQCVLPTALGEMAVDRVVAGVGFAADEPAGKRRLAVIEHFRVRLVPVDQARLLIPECLAVFQRAAVEVPVTFGHAASLLGCFGAAATAARTFRYSILTTVRPRAFPCSACSNICGSASKATSCRISASWRGRRSVANRRHTASRSAGGLSELIPSRRTPRRMKGRTVGSSSMPPALPKLAINPR